MACCIAYCFGIPILCLVIIKFYIKYILTGWCRSKTCLTGKTVIVTGSNTGIGYEAALDFAMRGAKVILACRNLEKAEAARKSIIEKTSNENIIVKYIDLSSLESVRKFAADINATENRLDILVNNAGAAGLNDHRTKDGLQLLTQINYYGPFLLTNLLIGLLKKSAPSRIVNVSSYAARMSKLDVNNLDGYPGRFPVYANSKLCNILFTKQLAKRLEGTGVTSYSLHPGVVKTEIWRHNKGIFKIIQNFINGFMKTCEEGAQTIIYTAVEKDIEHYNGEHFEDCKRIKPYPNSTNEGFAKKVWEKTEEIVKLDQNELQF